MSKKLKDLYLSVPPATAAAEQAAPRPLSTVIEAPAAVEKASPSPAGPATAAEKQGRAAEAAPAEREVPLQVFVPASIRKKLALYCTAEGESLRSVMLQAIRGLGIEVSDAVIAGKRSRKNY